MQIDWGEATVYLSGVKTMANLFCARLCYSGAPLVLAYRRQNKDGFGAHAQKQAEYAALAAHCGFEAIFCNSHPEMKRVLWKA